GNCLVVVGALHLVGEGGLLELLRKDGYSAKQLD
ncbi:MAG: TraB/GumN family protein, partial [Gammaproteobacteria bacterium]|nr:TraB/GumN family protein [Gammaproteobacteria bacterium]